MFLPSLTPDKEFDTDNAKILYYDFDKPIKTTYYSKNYLRICTILEGKKQVVINDFDSIEYTKDDFTILAPNSKVILKIGNKTKALVIEVDNNVLSQLIEKVQLELGFEEIKKITNHFFLSKFNEETLGTYKKIVKAFNSNEKGKEFILNLYIQELLYEILKFRGAEEIIGTVKNAKINSIISYINDCYTKNIKIADIAKYFGMEDYEFIRYFKTYTCKTPKEYIKELRLKKARELLKHQSVTETCYDVGYENISYFIKEFKKAFNITPKQYQKEVKK
ncbi:helix-turn-helix domain-containing protein [Carboxydothermus pertinax]|uniref:AraC family transcriptional regulator n=1 Tax=Carboxydothermus pertinax TaxID=870242 RepID=A0A1L8CVN2_9THEO|nr:helix-turn-helix domain-containing protein [Carboxydothermus pertinax]GAV23015.1 AraC family transcriptional regulator [Carboxydothermus pertinax]